MNRSLKQASIEKNVRLLLHRARKPEQLGALPLAKALCQALGCSDPLVAIRRIVNETFPGNDPADHRFRILIERCDLDGTLTLEEAQEQFAFSLRHIHRQRTKAVSAIASRIRTLLEPGGADLPAANLLEGLAFIAADRDPAAAADIYRLVGDASQLRSPIDYLHARILGGEELDEREPGVFDRVSRSMIATLAAQSRELNGKPVDMRALLAYFANAAEPNDPATHFELEALQSMVALHRSDVAAYGRHARNLERLATDRPRWRMRALLSTTQYALFNGDVQTARELLATIERYGYEGRDLQMLGIAALLHSRLLFLQCDFDVASGIAQATQIALAPHIRQAHLCAHAVGRSELARQRPWAPPETRFDRPENAWDRLALETLAARAFLQEGDARRARTQSEELFARCNAIGYQGLAAFAAATVAGSLSVMGDTAGTATWLLRAHERYMLTGDRLLGHDLFAVPGATLTELASLGIEKRFTELLAQRIVDDIPALDGAVQGASLRAFISAMLRYAANPFISCELFDATLHDVNGDSDALLRAIDAFAPAFERIFLLHVGTLVPYHERTRFEERLMSSLERIRSQRQSPRARSAS